MRRLCSLLAIALLLAATLLQPPVHAANNIAAGKKTIASSYSDEYFPESVLDGDQNTFWTPGTTTVTGAKGGSEFIGVDLGAPYVLSRVRAMSRRDVNQEHSRSGWVLQASNDSDFKEFVRLGEKKEPGAFGSDLDVKVTDGSAYRYVRLTSQNYMVVAELEVYGEQAGDTRQEAAYTDVTQTKYEGASLLLRYLGVMKGQTGTEFGPYALLTRAEAALAVARLTGQNILPETVTVFADVPADHEAAAAVTLCVHLGIVQPGERFRPDAYVTAAEFLKMTLAAADYGGLGELRGGYPSGYLLVARELGLMKNMEFTADAPIGRGDAALLLYRTLLAPAMGWKGPLTGNSDLYGQTGQPLLEARFLLRAGTGIVTGNQVTDLTSARRRNAAAVTVDEIEYTDLSGTVDAMIGRRIGFIATRENELVCAWQERTQLTVIDLETVTAVSWESIETTDRAGNRETYPLKNGVDLLKNGVADLSWTPELLMEQTGRLELVDNDLDGICDVVDAYIAQVLIIDQVSVSAGSTEIQILDRNGTASAFEQVRRLHVTANGAKSTIDGLGKNDLAYIYRSDNGANVRIEAFHSQVTGVVEEVSDDFLVIGQRQYLLSRYWKHSGARMPAAGSETTIVLNEKEEAVWPLDETEGRAGELVVFIQKLSVDSGLGDEVEIRVFTENGSFETLAFAQKVTVDGRKISSSELLDAFADGARHFTGKFALVTKSGGMITRLETEAYQAGDTSRVKKRDFALEDDLVNIPTMAGVYHFNFLRMPLRSSTPVFIIPFDGGAFATDRSFDQYYRISSSDVSFGVLTQLKPLFDDMAFYGEEASGYPSFAAVYQSQSGASWSGMTAIDDAGAPGMIVRSVGRTLIGGEEYSLIQGIDLGNGREKSIPVSDDVIRCYEAYKIQQEKPQWLISQSHLIDGERVDPEQLADYSLALDQIGAGDVIRYQMGGTAAIAVERVYANDEKAAGRTACADGSFYSASYEYPTYPLSNFRLLYGQALSIKNGSLRVEVAGNEKNSQIIAADQLGKIFIFEDGRIQSGDVAALGSYMRPDDRILLYSKNGVFTSAVAYRYESPLQSPAP